MEVYQNIIGISVIFGCAWIFSSNKRAIAWKTICLAFILQAALGAFALYVPVGQQIFEWLAKQFSHLLSFPQIGVQFLFGPLADMGFVFVFSVLTVLVFFAALLAILYHFGIMQWIIRVFGGGLEKLLGSSRVESLYAVTNVFLGQSESPLTIKPYIARLTESELFTIMTCGMAAVSGAILAGYVALGVDMKFLISASFMSAPGSIWISKLLMPETKISDPTIQVNYEKHVNLVDAIGSGAMSGMKLAMGVGAMLLAFISLIALLNSLLGGLGCCFGYEAITLQKILGYFFAPISWLLGVPWHESSIVGSLIGEKIILNEFLAYIQMGHLKLSEYSHAVASFALCGFANISSIAIQMGLIGGLAPSRRADVARLGLRVVFAATMVNLMSAAMAGLFIKLSNM
ncbi:MAG: NupC/NupG family nucleoside CNT transporter [Endozoicomonadaceae bacterium]|nr:NupC/NupG family nucleoside CNT transporter [Endozoicomonadaceae bacterium]